METFSQELYNENDPSCNSIVAERTQQHLEQNGFTNVVHRPEDYGADWTATFEGKKVLIESQVKRGWDGGKFPYPTIGVLSRYGRKPHTQLSAMKETPCFHILISSDYKNAVILDWIMIRNYSSEMYLPSERGIEKNFEIHRDFSVQTQFPTTMSESLLEYCKEDPYNEGIADSDIRCRFCEMKNAKKSLWGLIRCENRFKELVE